MKVSSYLIQFILVLMVVACSTKGTTLSKQEHIEGVEIKPLDEKIETKETAAIPLIGSETKTEIPAEATAINKVEDKPGINLMVGPGGYHSFGLVGFFKSLEKKHIKIKQLSGIEMGGVIAALYAKHRKSSVVEWEIFKLINKIDEDEILYTAHWNQVMTEFIKKNFNGIDFSDLQISLRLASQNKHGEVEWFDSGSVETALLESLKIKPEAFKKFIWPMKIEGEELISIDILSSNLNFKQKDSVTYYNEFLTLVKEMKKQSTQTINLKFTQGFVDSYKNWQNNGPIAQGYGFQLAKSLLGKNLKGE